MVSFVCYFILRQILKSSLKGLSVSPDWDVIGKVFTLLFWLLNYFIEHFILHHAISNFSKGLNTFPKSSNMDGEPPIDKDLVSFILHSTDNEYEEDDEVFAHEVIMVPMNVSNAVDALSLPSGDMVNADSRELATSDSDSGNDGDDNYVTLPLSEAEEEDPIRKLTLDLMFAKGVDYNFKNIHREFVLRQTEATLEEDLDDLDSVMSAEMTSDATDSSSDDAWVYLTGDLMEPIETPSCLSRGNIQALIREAPANPEPEHVLALIELTRAMIKYVTAVQKSNRSLRNFVNASVNKEYVDQQTQTDREDEPASVEPIVPPSDFALSSMSEEVFDMLQRDRVESSHQQTQTDQQEETEALGSLAAAEVVNEVTDSDGDWDLVEGEEAENVPSPVLNDVHGTEIEADWDIVEDETAENLASPSAAEVSNNVDDTYDDADWDILDDEDQENGADEVGAMRTTAAANEDDSSGSVDVQNPVSVTVENLPCPTASDQEDGIVPEGEEEQEEEQENEERLKDLLRPSAFDWMDEAEDDGEESAVTQSEDGFPRDSNGSLATQAAPSSDTSLTEDNEGHLEVTELPEVGPAAPSDEIVAEENPLEQDGPLVHHFNWDGAPVFEHSGTAPEVSLLVKALPPKKPRRGDKCRFWSIMHRAYLFVDPVIVMLEEGDKLRTRFKSVKELVRYATGRTFKFYSPYGAWVADPQGEESIAVDEERDDVDKNERNIVSNQRLGSKIACHPSSGREGKLRPEREHWRVRAQHHKPSPLRQMMTVDDLPTIKEVTTGPPVVLAEKESQQGDSSSKQSAVDRPPRTQVSQTNLGPDIDSSSDPDTDWEVVEMSNELRDIRQSEGKTLEPQTKSDLKSDSCIEEYWVDVLKKDCLPRDLGPVESRKATPMEPPKSGSLGMGWVEDYIPSCPEPDRKVDGLGHNHGVNFTSSVKVTVLSLLLDPEPTSTPEGEYAVVDEDLPSSLYSREIDEPRHPHDIESEGSDTYSLSSSAFIHHVDSYNSIVAGEFNAVSFDDDASMLSSEELPLPPDPEPTLQSSSSLEEPADVPLPPSPPLRHSRLRRRARRPRANLNRHVALRHRVTPLRTTPPIRRSLSTMANRKKRCPCRMEPNPLSDAPAAPEPGPSNPGPECRFPANYDSFNRLGVKPPRKRQPGPLALLGKCISKVRDGTRVLLEKSKRGLTGTRANEREEDSGRRVRRKLTKRRK